MTASPKKHRYLQPAKHLPVAIWPVQQWREFDKHEYEDEVVIEEPFEVRVNGRTLATIMRTPGKLENDRELALGFLLSEGIISEPALVAAMRRTRDKDNLPAENVLEIQLRPDAPNPFADDDKETPGHFERRFTIGSSCGLCGKTSIEQVCRWLAPLEQADFKVSSQVLYGLPDKLRAAQAVFEHTGGLHAAGLFSQDGRLQLLREDIGRHNAVDKLIGRMALDGKYPLVAHILLVSGRVSFEIVQKALAARIPLIAAVSAPSSLALELAAESGITLIGFLRGRQMNVYTHSARIIA